MHVTASEKVRVLMKGKPYNNEVLSFWKSCARSQRQIFGVYQQAPAFLMYVQTYAFQSSLQIVILIILLDCRKI